MHARAFAAALLLTAACQYREEVATVPDGSAVFPYANSKCGECEGCCQGPFCESGTEHLACGRNGAPCASCQGQLQCVDHACVLCGPSNCKGCCDFFGQCVQGGSDHDCGAGGLQCSNCGLGRCVSGRCGP
jgi:hypothetical protein